MKTVLDLQKIDKNERVYDAKTVEEIFEAIEKELSINNQSEYITLLQPLYYKFVWELEGQYGLKVDCFEKKTIRFRGHTMWVYFCKEKPVYFTTASSGTDTPPHIGSYSLKVPVEFDKFEKIKF